jgi:hypothetical protein
MGAILEFYFVIKNAFVSMESLPQASAIAFAIPG